MQKANICIWPLTNCLKTGERKTLNMAELNVPEVNVWLVGTLGVVNTGFICCSTVITYEPRLPRRSVATVLHLEQLHKVTAAAFPTWLAVTSPSYSCSYLFSASGFLAWKHRLEKFLGEASWDLTASCQIALPQLASGILQLSRMVTAVGFFWSVNLGQWRV